MVLNVLVTLITFTSFAFAQTQTHEATPSCLEKVRTQMEARMSTQESKYGKLKPHTHSQFLEGTYTQEAIVLVHGFIASPYEVQSIGKNLNHKGYTVLMPLLPGFGGTAEAANTVSSQDWINETREAFLDLSTCYPRVSLAGFSLGGSVVTALALKDDEVRRNLGSLLLISPAIRLKHQGILTVALPTIDLFTDTIKTTRANRLLSALGNRDLEIPAHYPEYYNEEIPIHAARELKKLGRSIQLRDFSKLKGHPVWIISNGYDRTVKTGPVRRRAKRHHNDLRTVLFPKDQRAKHQLLVPEGNSGIGSTVEKISSTFENR